MLLADVRSTVSSVVESSAGVISGLKLVELNSRRNQSLEAKAKPVFPDWVVLDVCGGEGMLYRTLMGMRVVD
ncbi:hypothetical protein E2C01_052429 [Portunus trituberculatus]|uniref:Uncharacterized protein n=1 Tax=Portunus trituberculatus TaxID=210409 RepID=A0A5B7GPB8_PORTR|nr:hypothetical protein [Portunus trituberculatus]